MHAATHQLINQDSGVVEYYTPAEIIASARATMGRIDLDPASSLIANEMIKASKIFTQADDGLSQEWIGRVWMNHPFSKAFNSRWINKLVNSYLDFGVTEACCICYASTSERWFQPLMQFPQCFICPRTRYMNPDGTRFKGPTKGSVVTYMGENLEAFKNNFKDKGTIKIAA